MYKILNAREVVGSHRNSFIEKVESTQDFKLIVEELNKIFPANQNELVVKRVYRADLDSFEKSVGLQFVILMDQDSKFFIKYSLTDDEQYKYLFAKAIVTS
ncbi:hypothetical protein [Paenibacillus sp. NPDC055715]